MNAWAGFEDERPENSYAQPQPAVPQPQRNRNEMENGTYPARATGDAKWGLSQNNNAQISVLFRISKGPFEGAYAGWIGTFAEGKATEIAINALRAMGWKGMDPTADLDGITDNEVDLVIEMAVSNSGNVYPQVKYVNRPGSGAMITFKQPLEGQELRQWGPFIAQAAKALWLEQHPNEPMPGQPARQRPAAQPQPQPQTRQAQALGRQGPPQGTNMVPPGHPMGQPQGPVSAQLQRQQYQQQPAQRPPMRPAPQQPQQPQFVQQPAQQSFVPGDEQGTIDGDPF